MSQKHSVIQTLNSVPKVLTLDTGTDNQLSYIRTDHIEQRKILMERWAAFVYKKNNVIEITNAR